jgi:phosphohistidine phosphatase
MKKLYLLRHAQAENPQSVKDEERPLSSKGISECNVINAYLIENNVNINLVLCSTALRTTQTAALTLKNITGFNIIYNKKLYLATAGEILKEIAKIEESTESVLVVCHNPGIAQLAGILANRGDWELLKLIKNDYPTSALAKYSFNVAKWQDVQPGAGMLESLVMP